MTNLNMNIPRQKYIYSVDRIGATLVLVKILRSIILMRSRHVIIGPLKIGPN